MTEYRQHSPAPPAPDLPGRRRLAPETLAAQALGEGDAATRALVPPVHFSTTFERDPDLGYPAGFSYGRDTTPAFGPAERLLARLEGGPEALLFSSGMAAATAVFLVLTPGAQVVVPDVMYWSLRGWLQGWAAERGLRVVTVPAGDLAALQAALRPGETALVWLETPANPTWTVTDIAAAAHAAHAAGALLAVDSTVATPVLTRPLALGADLVMHAASKALNGHSDVLAGALVAADPQAGWWRRIRDVRQQHGAVLGPMEAWLLLRGMRTLHLRVRRACDSALTIARRFERHRRIAAVLYPGLESHPGYAVAARQMEGGFGSMLSLRVEGGRDAAVAVAARLQVFRRATSLGGVESLVEHRRSVEGAGSPVPDDLLRLSVGIEDPGDLIADLEEALR